MVKSETPARAILIAMRDNTGCAAHIPLSQGKTKEIEGFMIHGRSGKNLSSGQQTHFETGQVPRPNAVNPVVESTISSIAMCRCMRILSNPFRGTSFHVMHTMQREMHMLCALYIPWSAYVDSCCLSSPMQYSNQTLGPLTKWLKDLYINYYNS